MEILRVPSNTIEAVIEVTDPSTAYEYTITDLADFSVISDSGTSDENSEVSIPLVETLDGHYKITIDSTDHYVDVVRPYSDYTGQADVATYQKNESFARALIDSVIPEGFYHTKAVIETTGLGADYIALWKNVNKILKVYENNVLVYDASDPDSYTRSFSLTDDKTAITEDEVGTVNRAEGAYNVIPAGASDILDMKYSYRGFPKTFDYKFVVEVGYPNIPKDIVRATEILIDDIECDRLEYFTRFIKSYNTDQFKIALDDRMFEGTGNFLVDKMLSKYAKSIRIVGVL